MTSLIAPIIQVCDAISGARPGARREVVESYIKRLKEMEDIALSYPVSYTHLFEQARQFTQATHVTSLAITKLDATATGGVVIGLSDPFRIPVRYIGIGEGIDQRRIFDRRAFVDALFGDGK